MDMIKVEKIHEDYKIRCKDENYDNANTLMVVLCSSRILKMQSTIDSETDELKRKQYTIRLEKDLRTLAQLIKR
jgi:hypothetical protein